MSTSKRHRPAANNWDRSAVDPDAYNMHSRRETHHPAALAEALRAVHRPPDTPSDSNSDSGNEAKDKSLQSVLLRRRSTSDSYDNSRTDTPDILPLEKSELNERSSPEKLHQSLPKFSSVDKGKKTYVVASDDAELREIFRKGLERASHP